MLFGARPLEIKWAASTNIGKRSINEDSVLALEDGERYLFVAADGLGGHGMGKEASSLVVDVFRNEFSELSKCCSFLETTFDKAQAAVLKSQEERRLNNQMKTTAVALVINGGKFAYGHVGDTRLYMYKNQKLAVRTLDHSVPQMLALSGDIKEEEISTHPDRSRLIYVIGDDWQTAKYEVSKQKSIKKGMSFFLATDGVWEVVPNPAPEERKTPDLWLGSVLGKVQKASEISEEFDNFSAIAVMVR